MKLAVVHQVGSTGGWKYIYLLVKNIKKIAPETHITVFYSQVPKILGASLLSDLRQSGISLHTLPPNFQVKNKYPRKITNFLWNILRYFKFVLTHKTIKYTNGKTIGRLANYFDAVFYTWPYNIEPPVTKTPLFFIPHDFILSHFFGYHCGNYYNRENALGFKTQLQSFLEQGTAIVSSHFIVQELKNIFPAYQKEVPVVYLSNFSTTAPPAEEDCAAVLKKYGLNFPYILLATNDMHHKNMGQVLGAYYDIRQKYPEVKLIVTGNDLAPMEAACRSPLYFDHFFPEGAWDLKILGLLSESDFAAILKKASVLVHPSFNEAGGGSCVEAWSLGTPVAMSDIEPFRNQMNFLGVKAELFDPRNSQDIARAVLAVLDNTDITLENVRISYEAMQRYTWEDVAKAYLNFFKGVV